MRRQQGDTHHGTTLSRWKLGARPHQRLACVWVQVEDLFYNMHTRRAAFKNLNDQYRAILDVVTRYAVHFGRQGISFTCKKVSDPRRHGGLR